MEFVHRIVAFSKYYNEYSTSEYFIYFCMLCPMIFQIAMENNNQ